jgi:uncharacterized FlaG/YvyC family protein
LLKDVKSIEENQERLKKLKEKKLQMEKRNLENKQKLEKYGKMYKKYNDELAKIQADFNASVDPFNNNRKVSSNNKQSHQAMVKIYAGIDKRIENAKIQHRRQGKKGQPKETRLIKFHMIPCSWSHVWKLSSCEIQNRKAEGEAKLLEGTF